jgi:chromosome segregation ATPase
MKTTTINTMNTTINAIGNYNSAHTKAVVCKETCEVYSSVGDAAEAAGVSYPMINGHLRGKYKSVKGKHYGYLVDVLNNPDEVFTQLRKTVAELQQYKADAKKWNEHQAKLTANEQKEAKRQEKIDRLKAKIARHESTAVKAHEKASKADLRVVKAKAELAELLNKEVA